MSKDKVNESATDCEQMLLDLMEAVAKSKDKNAKAQLEALAYLRNSISKNTMEEAEAKFRKRDYSHVSYVQSATLLEHPGVELILQLSDAALRVYTLIEHMMIRQYIRLSHTQVADILNISVRTSQRAIKELLEKGILEIAMPSVRHTAPVYCVSSAFLRVGKQKRTKKDIDALNRQSESLESMIHSKGLILTTATVYEKEKPIKIATLEQTN